MPEYRNIHGRKWGRGLRPWLLLPKFLFVAVFLGGLVGTLVLGMLGPRPVTHEQWDERLNLLRRAYAFVILPSLCGAIAMGALLALLHWRSFLRMRWLQAKLAVVLLVMPALHLIIRSRWAALRETVSAGREAQMGPTLYDQVGGGIIAAIALTLVVVWLGRIKPRLGQNYARSLPHPMAASQKKDTLREEP